MHSPVPRTVLTRSGLVVSRLGLGLAHMHTMSSTAERLRLIDTALDLGITHFDTARLYSDGLSESTLGAALALKGTAARQGVTIATKFGLLPHTFIGAAGLAAKPLRKARSVLTRLKLIDYPRRSYTAATLSQSLRASLAALKTDYIDIYFFHEPSEDTAPPDEVFEALERHKREGAVRFIGVSGATIDGFVQRYGSRLDVIQSAEGSWSPERFVPDLSHSLFSATPRARGAPVPEAVVRQALVDALARRPQGGVIVQTRHPAHLRKLAEWSGESRAP